MRFKSTIVNIIFISYSILYRIIKCIKLLIHFLWKLFIIFLRISLQNTARGQNTLALPTNGYTITRRHMETNDDL